MKAFAIVCLTCALGVGCLPAASKAEVWLSNPTRNVWLERQPDIRFSNSSQSADFTVQVTPSTRFQTMDGFGASLTESSTYLLKERLSASKREAVLQALFGPSGINISLLRQPMGATDFNFAAWTYNDTLDNESDMTLSHFTLSPEDSSIRPILDQAFAVNPGRISLMATPWSPPAWMKTIPHLYGSFGGVLSADKYEVYADYFVKYLLAYQAKGTPVYALTVQNEPKNPASWPGMIMTAEEQIGFIDVLSKKLESNGLGSVKILAYDHNYDDIDYARTVLASSVSSKVAGSAFHYYSALSHSNLSTLHAEFPDKGIWMTEGGTGTWIGGGSERAMFLDLMMHTIRFPRNWAKSYVLWNVALDQNGKPALDGISSQNQGLLTIRSDGIDQVAFNHAYYGLGHSSKFVDPGAVRIESSSQEGNVESVAYQNPDGSIVVVLLNSSSTRKRVKIRSGEDWFLYTVSGQSAVTFRWK